MNKSGIAAQIISHPKGGGAIAPLGETFAPDPFTGSGTLAVPIGLPPGRGSVRPDLSLTYSAGHGNGLFGLGWVLSIPGVTRDSSKGIPTYGPSADIFTLSSAERLVMVHAAPDGTSLYRPRTEGT